MTLGGHFLDDLQRRELACRLARHGVNGEHGRAVGDPVHEEITQGRMRQWEEAMKAGAGWAQKMVYSSCGDLVHWVLWRLGVRSPSPNRDVPEDNLRWTVGANLARLNGAAAWRAAGGGREPQPGDMLHLDQHDGHVCVLLEWGDVVVTADYGQPYGRLRRRDRTADGGGGWRLNGKRLTGWLDLDHCEIGAAPTLPEGLLIPAGGATFEASLAGKKKPARMRCRMGRAGQVDASSLAPHHPPEIAHQTRRRGRRRRRAVAHDSSSARSPASSASASTCSTPCPRRAARACARSTSAGGQ